MVPIHIKDLQHASRDLSARWVKPHTYIVESRSHPDTYHHVEVCFDTNARIVKATCTCRWSQFNGIACSHVLAVLEHMAATKNRSLSFWIDEDRARQQKHRLFQLVGHHTKTPIWITSRSA